MTRVIYEGAMLSYSVSSARIENSSDSSMRFQRNAQASAVTSILPALHDGGAEQGRSKVSCPFCKDEIMLDACCTPKGPDFQRVFIPPIEAYTSCDHVMLDKSTMWETCW